MQSFTVVPLKSREKMTLHVTFAVAPKEDKRKNIREYILATHLNNNRALDEFLVTVTTLQRLP